MKVYKSEKNLGKGLKGSPDLEFPAGLHERIMRGFYLERLKPAMLFILFLLGSNLAISAWHLWSRMAELEGFGTIYGMLDGFEMSLDFVKNFAQNSVDLLPLTSLTIFLVNLALAGAAIYFFLKLKKISVLERSHYQT